MVASGAPVTSGPLGACGAREGSSLLAHHTPRNSRAPRTGSQIFFTDTSYSLTFEGARGMLPARGKQRWTIPLGDSPREPVNGRIRQERPDEDNVHWILVTAIG